MNSAGRPAVICRHLLYVGPVWAFRGWLAMVRGGQRPPEVIRVKCGAGGISSENKILRSCDQTRFAADLREITGAQAVKTRTHGGLRRQKFGPGGRGQ